MVPTFLLEVVSLTTNLNRLPAVKHAFLKLELAAAATDISVAHISILRAQCNSAHVQALMDELFLPEPLLLIINLLLLAVDQLANLNQEPAPMVSSVDLIPNQHALQILATLVLVPMLQR